MTTPRPADAPRLRQRLEVISARGRLRRHETRLTLAGAFALVVSLLVLHWAAAMAVGGAPGPIHHLGYPPILLAAYLFGLRGALLVAVVAAAVSGPAPILVRPDPASWAGDESALLRVLAFLLVALITGIAFDHLRSALDAWRTTAIQVAEREEAGMVALARGAEAKDTDTGDHIARVRQVTERLALGAGMDRATAADLGWAAMLHDIGKLHVPDALLGKPGPLTGDEQAIVRMHTIWGAEILAAGEAFATARIVARSHHEDFDGSGYPDGLRGEAIPLAARIVRVADAFDAMTHDRRYQPARGLDWAMEELRHCAGRQFDPDLVRLFLELLETGALTAILDRTVPIGDRPAASIRPLPVPDAWARADHAGGVVRVALSRPIRRPSHDGPLSR